MKKYTYTIAVALMSSLVTTLVCSLAAILFVLQPLQKQAIERGFASWVVTNNATGATKFAWNEPASVEEDFFAQIEKPLK